MEKKNQSKVNATWQIETNSESDSDDEVLVLDNEPQSQEDDNFYQMTPEECQKYLTGILNFTHSGNLTREKMMFLRSNVAKVVSSSGDITHDHTSFIQKNKVLPVLKNHVLHLSLSNPPLDTEDHATEGGLDLDEDTGTVDDNKLGLDIDDSDEELLDEAKVYIEHQEEEVTISHLYSNKYNERTASKAICFSIIQSFYVEKKGILVEASIDRIEDATADYYKLPKSKQLKSMFEADIKNGMSLAQLRSKVFTMSDDKIKRILLFIEFPKMCVKTAANSVKRVCDFGDTPVFAGLVPPTSTDISLLAKDIMRLSTYVTGSSKLFANTARCYIAGIRVSDAYYKAYMRLMDVDIPPNVQVVNVYRGGLIFCKGLMRKYPDRDLVIINVSNSLVTTDPAFVAEGRTIKKIYGSTVVTCEALDSVHTVLYLDVGSPDNNSYAHRKRDRATFIKTAKLDLSKKVRAHKGKNKLFQTYVGVYHILGKVKCHPSVFGASGVAIYKTFSSGYPSVKLLSLMLTMSRYCVTYPYHLVPRLKYVANYKGAKFTCEFKHPAVCDFRLTESERIQLTGGGDFDFGVDQEKREAPPGEGFVMT